MGSNANDLNIPQARQEVGVNFQPGYNGHLIRREAGSVGGQMVKRI